MSSVPCFSGNEEVFSLRRQKVGEFMGGGIAVFRTSSGSSSNIYYLTGFDEPDAALLLIPGEVSEFILFVRPSNPGQDLWTGNVYGIEGAEEIFKADKAHSLDQFETLLPNYLRNKGKIFFSYQDRDLASTLVQSIWRPWNRMPKTLVDITEYIHEMRLIKSTEEVVRIKKAADITCQAHIEAMKMAEPGINEAEIEAVIEFIFRREGGSGPGFPSIVGSGPNSTILHYESNNRQTQDGDLVVMDIGAEFGHYTADVTRTMPVNGKFSDKQRDLYSIVLQAQEAAVSMIAPGIGIDDIHSRAVGIIAEGLFELGLITDKESSWQMRVWLMYRINHWLGMDVHDVGDYRRSRNSSRILEPGMVLTVEPGVYIREESIDNLEKTLGRSVPEEEIRDFVDRVRPAVQKYKNIGIRIEDDVLVTENGSENLSLLAPKTIEEIEKTMRTKSVLKK
jgi:Xaa-Pro aminopeptidase